MLLYNLDGFSYFVNFYYFYFMLKYFIGIYIPQLIHFLTE